MKALITGGAGFIGSHLVDRMLARGADVLVLDDFNDFYDPAVKRRNIAAAASSPRFRLVEGDIRDADAVGRAFGSPTGPRRPPRGAGRRPALARASDPLSGRQPRRHADPPRGGAREDPEVPLRLVLLGLRRRREASLHRGRSRRPSRLALRRHEARGRAAGACGVAPARDRVLGAPVLHRLRPAAEAGDGDPQVHAPDRGGGGDPAVRRRRVEPRLYLYRRHPRRDRERRPAGPWVRDPEPGRIEDDHLENPDRVDRERAGEDGEDPRPAAPARRRPRDVGRSRAGSGSTYTARPDRGGIGAS